MRVFIILVAVSLCLGACGIKPGQVDPPEDAPETKFPRTYPNPSTDP